MFKGTLALVIRYILLIGGGALASAGLLTATADLGYYCFDTRHVADALATGISLMVGGGASAVAGIGWRFWAKRRDGVT